MSEIPACLHRQARAPRENWTTRLGVVLAVAGVTSSISILQPAVSFLEDEFSLNRKQSVAWTGILCFLMSQLAIFGLRYGVLDEMDFWGGTFLLVLFGLFEAIIFGWIFGFHYDRKVWKELAAFALCFFAVTILLVELPPALYHSTWWHPRTFGIRPSSITVGRLILGFLYVPMIVWLFSMSAEKKRWFYRIDQGWGEMHRSADLRAPAIYKIVLKYITPLYIVIVLWRWLKETGIDVIKLKNVPQQNYFHILSFRVVLILCSWLGCAFSFMWHGCDIEKGGHHDDGAWMDFHAGIVDYYCIPVRVLFWSSVPLAA